MIENFPILKEKGAFKSHKNIIWHISWSKDGFLLASCSSDKTVKIWSFLPKTYKLKLETTLDGLHTKTISCVDWSFDGKRLAISSFDATISIWLR